MDDLISRQAAMDALNEYFARIGKLKRRGLTKGEKAISLDTVGIIKTLPSAQADSKELSFTHKALDTISRQAAIDATWFEPSYTDPLNVLTEVRDKLKVLPSAQPERPTGTWILVDNQRREDTANGNYAYICSNCLYTDVHAKSVHVPYCWQCGAKMKEKQNAVN